MHATRVLGVLARRPLFPRTEAEALATLRATFGNLAADSPFAPRPVPVAAGAGRTLPASKVTNPSNASASDTDRAA